MTKAIVVASSYGMYMNLIRQFNLDRRDLRYVQCWEDVCGFHWNTPVIIVEGYEHNKRYTLKFMNMLGHRFDNIGFLSEGEIWNEE